MVTAAEESRAVQGRAGAQLPFQASKARESAGQAGGQRGRTPSTTETTGAQKTGAALPRSRSLWNTQTALPTCWPDVPPLAVEAVPAVCEAEINSVCDWPDSNTTSSGFHPEAGS